MEQLYDYLDYKKYLRDYFEMVRKQSSFFSFRYVERRVGIDASNIVKVINGKRELSRSGVEKFVSFLGLEEEQAKYFRTLVAFARAKSDKESKRLFEQLLAIKEISAEQVCADRYEFYLKWYYTAIAAVLYYYPFYGKDYSALAAQLKPAISAAEAEQSVALLTRLGFVEQDKNGRYIHCDSTLTTGDEWFSTAIHAFQQETIALAQASLERDPKPIRDISTVTLTTSAEGIARIKELTREYRRAVLETMDDCDHPDRAYQLNIQLFPLSQIPEEPAQ